MDNEIIDIKINVSEELPKEAKEVISEIKSKYKYLLKEELINKNEVRLSYKFRVPEIIKKYLSIDSSYRETLKNIEGKDSKQLMMESLGHINDILTIEIKNLNEEKIKDLSITQRHLKAVKNTF
jgi:hypothetical protein